MQESADLFPNPVVEVGVNHLIVRASSADHPGPLEALVLQLLHDLVVRGQLALFGALGERSALVDQGCNNLPGGILVHTAKLRHNLLKLLDELSASLVNVVEVDPRPSELHLG